MIISSMDRGTNVSAVLGGRIRTASLAISSVNVVRLWIVQKALVKIVICAKPVILQR